MRSPGAGSLMSTWGILPELHPCMALAECMLLQGTLGRPGFVYTTSKGNVQQ